MTYHEVCDTLKRRLSEAPRYGVRVLKLRVTIEQAEALFMGRPYEFLRHGPVAMFRGVPLEIVE